MQNEKLIVVSINNQQEELLQRLIAEEKWGDTPSEVVKNIFRQWCQDIGIA